MSVDPRSHGEFRGQLAKMVTEKWLGPVTIGIEAAISASFQTDQVIRPVLTKDEVRRRFKLCVEGFCIMRKDLGWAVPRIVDELPVYLRKKLDHMDWEPDTDHKSWMGEERVAMQLDGEDIAPETPELEGCGDLADYDG